MINFLFISRHVIPAQAGIHIPENSQETQQIMSLRKALTHIFKTSFHILMILSFLMTFTSTASARIVKDLFAATVPVENYTEQQRNTALKTALEQVLVKVSGNTHVTTVSQIQNALTNKNIAKQVQGYNYIEPRETDPQPQLQLHITFNENAIKNVLKNSGQPFLGRQRPAVLLWVLLSNNPGDPLKLIEDENATPLINAFHSAFNIRGVPYVQPVVDLSLLQTLAHSQSGPMITSQLVAAAAPYDTDGLVIARIKRQSPMLWQADYQLRLGEQRLQWQNRGASIKEIARAGVNQIADVISNRYAQLQEAQQQHDVITVEVIGVDATEGFAKILQYLQALTSVDDVQASDLDGDTMQFSVTLHTSTQKFSEQIALDKFLQPVGETTDDQTTETQLTYRLAL